MSFSQALKSSLVYMPQISDPYKRMGRKSELMSLLVMSIGSFSRNQGSVVSQRMIVVFFLLSLFYTYIEVPICS